MKNKYKIRQWRYNNREIVIKTKMTKVYDYFQVLKHVKPPKNKS